MRRFNSRSVGLAIGLILFSIVVSGCFQTAGASLENTPVPPPRPTETFAQPAEPPVVQPTEPPIIQPTEPPVVQPTEPPIVQPTEPPIIVVTETPFQPAEVAQVPTAAFFAGPEATQTAIMATQFALATQILSEATQTAAVEQTLIATSMGTYVPPSGSEGVPGVQPTVAPVLGPLPNITGTPQGTLGAPGTGAAGGISGDCIYTVVEGDRIFRVAQRFGMSADALSRANGIVNPNMIVPGQRLHVPNCFAAPPLVFTPTFDPGVATAIPPTFVPGTGSGQVYVVQEGDTLFGIAMKYGVRVMAIAQANGITNINLIYIGQQITIP